MLAFSLSTFLITIINIGILFFVLKKVLFKPVSKFMENRRAAVQNSIEQAEKDRSQAKEVLEQYQEKLKTVDAEGAELIRSAREKAKQESDRIIAEGKAEADHLLEHTRKQLAAEQQAAMTLFRAEAAALVISASSRLLQRELTAEDSRRQAALLLQELGKPNVSE
jgi:F-type H+-transporting ATPase subunit b